jgi:hypothetical protein
VDISIILPLLVALVPIALFFALVRHRQSAATRRPVEEVAEPPADFGLNRDTDSEHPAPASESSDTSAAAAAAAGGALVIGYGVSHRSDDSGDRAASGDSRSTKS